MTDRSNTMRQSADQAMLNEVHPVRISVTKPPQWKSKQDICWTNMLTGDKMCNLEIFSASVVAWRRLNPTLTYQDLENELRKRGANTHIIVRKNDGPSPYRLGHIGNKNDTTIYDYYAMISCRFRTAALEELLEYHLSYEDNHTKLSKTGDIMGIVGQDNYDTIEDGDITKMNENNIVQFIATNSVEIKCYIT